MLLAYNWAMNYKIQKVSEQFFFLRNSSNIMPLSQVSHSVLIVQAIIASIIIQDMLIWW